MPSLPTPDADAAAHSARVVNHIREVIRRAGGWISLARYMELALYAPGLGYYVSGTHKFGAGGDFVTAPELGSLFARSVSRCIADVLAGIPGDILELGAGSGRFAADLLQELAGLGRLPERYLIIEPSPALALRQRETLGQRAPELAGRVVWLSEMPPRIRGVVFANEVLDALPVHLLVRRDGRLMERGVAEDAGRFVWAERPCADPALAAAAEKLSLPDGYLIEVNLAAPALTASLAERLVEGLVLFIDYGFGASEFYHPQRREGTLLCHYRHYALDDPFFLPGLTDITAHVNFSAVAEAGVNAGLELMGYTTQAAFLLDCGITGLLGEVPADDAARYLPLANEAQRLLSPAEMGELFKVLALSRGLARLPRGLRAPDLRHRL